MPWSREETELLKTQYKHGFTVKQSSEIIGKSRLDIINKLMSLGLKPISEETTAEQATIFDKGPKPRKRKVKITPEIEQRVIELRRNGRNYETIANITGVSQASVGRIMKNNDFSHCKMYEKEPASVPAETSPEINLSSVNNTTKKSFAQEQLKQIKAALESVDYCTMAKVGQAIGEAIGRIDTLINIMEARRNEE